MKCFNENPFRLPGIHECYICPECEGLYFLCGDDQGKYPTIIEVFSGLTLESEREEDYDLCRGCAAEKIREKLSDKTINRLKEQERNVQRLLEQLPQDLFDGLL